VKQAVESDYARHGQVASETVTLPQGVLQVNGENVPHTLETQLRAAGLPCFLRKGTLVLDAEHEVCRAGDVLTVDQCKLLVRGRAGVWRRRTDPPP
jgi:mRNA turnover protein 4